MPNIKSAKKRMKTSAENRVQNKVVKSRVLTARKKLDTAIAGGDAAIGQTAYRSYCSALDKAVKRGAVKANTASRGKSRASARMTKAQAAQQA